MSEGLFSETKEQTKVGERAQQSKSVARSHEFRARSYLDLYDQGKWVIAESTKVIEPKLDGGEVQFRIIKQNGSEKLQIKISDWRFPQPIEGIVESVNGKEYKSAIQMFQQIASGDKVRIQLQGAGGQLVLETRDSDILSRSFPTLGIVASTWVYLDIPRPGANMDSVKEGSLAEKIGLDKGEVILGAVYRDEKGQSKTVLFKNAKDFFNFMKELELAPDKRQKVQFIIKQPNEGREEVLKAFRGGQPDVLSYPPITFDPNQGNFRTN